jgi:hypothetical protein
VHADRERAIQPTGSLGLGEVGGAPWIRRQRHRSLERHAAPEVDAHVRVQLVEERRTLGLHVLCRFGELRARFREDDVGVRLGRGLRHEMVLVELEAALVDRN